MGSGRVFHFLVGGTITIHMHTTSTGLVHCKKIHEFLDRSTLKEIQKLKGKCGSMYYLVSLYTYTKFSEVKEYL